MKVCEICHGGCCRRYNPDITGIDMIKIAESLKVDINFFATALPVDEQTAAISHGKKPIFIFTDDNITRYYRFALKMEESLLFPGSYRCIFLNEFDAKKQESKVYDNIIARCGIYHIRPYTCRTFPVEFNPETKQTYVIDPHELFPDDEEPAYKLCPRPVQRDDYREFQAEMIKTIVAKEYEKQFFLQLSEKWNQNPDSSDYFIDFMKREYQNRIEHRTE